MNGVKCNYTLADLERFRNEDGAINLDLLNLDVKEENREKMGSQDREKFWIEFSDGNKALVKVNNLPERKTYGYYAELLGPYFTRQVGLEHARNDLVIYKGNKGILSNSILKEDEELFSLASFLDEDEEELENVDSFFSSTMTDLFTTCTKLMKKLKEEGMTKDEIWEVLRDFQKQMVYDMYVLAEDRHPENVSLIRNKKTGKIKLSTIYDSEDTLVLDRPVDAIQKLTNSLNFDYIKEITSKACPRIVIAPESEDYTLEDVYKNTFAHYIDDDEIGDFAFLCGEKINPKEAIAALEEKLHAKLPEEVKLMTILAVNDRKKDLNRIMEYGYEPPTSEKSSIEFNENRIIELLRKDVKLFDIATEDKIDIKENERDRPEMQI